MKLLVSSSPLKAYVRSVPLVITAPYVYQIICTIIRIVSYIYTIYESYLIPYAYSTHFAILVL